MSEIVIIWLSALVLQTAPHLIFILLQKSTHSVNMVLYSQNARLCRNCALIPPPPPTIMEFYEKLIKLRKFSKADLFLPLHERMYLSIRGRLKKSLFCS